MFIGIGNGIGKDIDFNFIDLHFFKGKNRKEGFGCFAFNFAQQLG